MRLAGTRRAAVMAALPAAVALLAWLVALQNVVVPARVVAGVLLAFVLPGAAGTAALFPDRSPSRVERIVLAPALSLAVLVLGGVLLNAMGLHLTTGTWGGLIAIATVVLAGVGFLRWSRAQSSAPPGWPPSSPPTGRPSPSAPAGGRSWPPAPPGGRVGQPVPSGRPQPVVPPEGEPAEGEPGGGARRTAWRMAPLALAVALLGGAAWIGLHSANTQNQQPFTALSMVPDDDANPADQLRPVTFAVDSHEGQPIRYTLKVHADSGQAWQFALRLQPGEVWKRDLQVPTTGRVTADLFKEDGDTPYRSVFVSGPQ